MHQNIRKLLFTTVSVVVLLSTVSIFPKSSVSATATLNAEEITQEMEIGWNIGNSLDSSSLYPTHETSWGESNSDTGID